MNRRSFMKIGASMAAGGCLPPWLAARAHGDGAHAAPPTIVLVDGELAESRACAALAVRDGARIVDIESDVGVLWHATLAGARTRLVGALRASDFFVLRHLAASEGRVVSQADGAYAITFRIDIDADAHAIRAIHAIG